MIDERVVERLQAFLWDAACAIEGRKDGRWSSKFHPMPENYGDSWLDGFKHSNRISLKNTDSYDGSYVAALVLQGAGFEVTPARFIKESVFVKLNGRDVDAILQKFDRATELLPAARLDYLLGGRMAHQVFLPLQKAFERDSLPVGSPHCRPEFVWAQVLDEPMLQSLKQAIGVEMRREFQVSSPVGSASAVPVTEPRIETIARDFAKGCKRERVNLNKAQPDYPMPEFDSKLIDQLCAKVEAGIRNEQERIKSLRKQSNHR